MAQKLKTDALDH